MKKNGSPFYGEVSAKKLNDGNILGIVRDVTARKKLELAAWDNLQKFRKAFNSRTIGMAIFDEKLRFVDVNPYFLEKLGYSLQEVKGKTFEELGPIIIDEKLKRKEALKGLNEHGKVLSMELIVRPNGKEKIHFSTSAESYVVDNKNYILATYLDRTEEKKAQEKIISSEKKYRELTERISDAFVAFDKNWDFTYVNNKASKIIGRDSIGLVGKNLWEEFPQFAQTEAYDTFKSALENQKYVQFEQFHKPYDVWIENHIYPSPEGLTIYFRDITKKKVAEQENRKLLTVVENSPGFIGLSRMDSNSIYLNQYGRKLVGLPPEGSISDISWFDFFPENTVELIKDEYLPIVLKEGTWSGEAYLKNFETNTYVPTAFSAFTINDKVSKEPIGIGSVAFDLTERKKVEKEILDLQSKMNAAIRIGKIGYWDWHIESGIIDWSERMYEIYDVEHGREINVAFTKTLVHPEDLEMHDKTIEHKTKNRDDSSFTYRIVDRNENIKHVLVQMEVKVDLDGNPINYQGTAIDITQEKEAEVLLERQNQELKKTNSELDSFVYSASHELRAPLASLLGLVNIMKKEKRSDDSLLNLRMMENSITRLDEFIGDIVQYSRNKHIEVVPEKINFSALISRSLEDFWYLENTQKIKVIKNIEEGDPFFSDNKRVMVLLNNFISNAIKYHDMEKTSPSIWINIKTNQKEAIIRIEDNGTGIAKENQDKIYNMFYRTTSKVTGSGIGLFIVKEILDRLKGTVSLESTLNKGSVFTIKLPNLSPGD
ncbi:PAS domain S-box protein [Maribacter litopenaei]|uniref:histidine kinase n=1 Tax=Maribacter litopenaei TaxID=2976127 RepID=A0ABY5Y7E2_9FLAO|nr:PAS domain S-box protein [Maribacter litopenaei]UWX54937.1 PAS domain S-box protein [Maribacter litopenaei]